MSGYFPKSRPLRGIVKIEVNLSNYAKKKSRYKKRKQVLIHQNLLEKVDLAN